MNCISEKMKLLVDNGYVGLPNGVGERLCCGRQHVARGCDHPHLAPGRAICERQEFQVEKLRQHRKLRQDRNSDPGADEAQDSGGIGHHELRPVQDRCEAFVMDAEA